MRKYMRHTAQFTLAAVVSVFMLFVLRSIALQDHVQNSVVGCPFMTDENSFCGMTPEQHIAQWEGIFLGVSTQKMFDILAVVLAAGSLWFIVLRQLLWRPAEKLAMLRRWVTARAGPYRNEFNILPYLYSLGILNPKLYEHNV